MEFRERFKFKYVSITLSRYRNRVEFRGIILVNIYRADRVDIGTEWNLEQIKKRVRSVISPSRYRNRVEFRARSRAPLSISKRRRYKNRVEFRGHNIARFFDKNSVDIGTEWNLE